MKSEPDVFSIDDLRKKKVSPWDGVRNYQARNHMRAMQVGDRVLFYHSSAKPSGVAGLATVARAAYPDHSSWDASSPFYDPASTPDKPRWDMVDVRHEKTFKRFLAIDDLRAIPELGDMQLFMNSRLSVQPVAEKHFRIVAALGDVG